MFEIYNEKVNALNEEYMMAREKLANWYSEAIERLSAKNEKEKEKLFEEYKKAKAKEDEKALKDLDIKNQ